VALVSDGLGPVDERRQRVVESVGILDQAHQERLDRITRMATVAFGVPISSITMLDGELVRFPSAVGIPARPMPRRDTFCDRSVRIGGSVVSEDTLTDPRFRDLALVHADPPFRFYAAHPLCDPFGNVMGTFCVYDHEPREFGEREQRLLAEMGAWAEVEVLALAEMSRAHDAQVSMLPSAPIDRGSWHVDGICLPALSVGGDYFDYALDGDILHFGLGDVMGKGTAAALIGAGMRVALRAAHLAVVNGADLGLVLDRLEQGASSDLERAGSFVTLFEGVVDLESGHLRYADAGLGLALLVHADGSHEQLTGEDLPIGVMPGSGFHQHEHAVAEGDRMLVFSDGVLDLLDDPDDWMPPLAALLHSADDPRDVLGQIMMLAIDRTPVDDVTALVVCRRPAGEAA
jgi:hypothetical protein